MSLLTATLHIFSDLLNAALSSIQTLALNFESKLWFPR